MKTGTYTVFLLIFFAYINIQIYADDTKKSAVSYELNGGRFGDNLKSFIQAYWLAYIHSLVFLYIPFPGSEGLNMHTILPPGGPDVFSTYRTIQLFKRYSPSTITNLQETVYITTFYSKIPINWLHVAFMEELNYLISPRYNLDIPHDITQSIALHIRRGGGFAIDTDRVRRRRPAHFPHIAYYAQSLDYLLNTIGGTYTVYLFTDDPNPHLLATEIMKQLSKTHAQRITMHYREDHNSHDSHILDDFFALQKAKYLIRPKSNFSLYAERLGNHTITISPAHVRQGDPWGIVESVLIRFHNDQHEVLLST